jgi:transposase
VQRSACFSGIFRGFSRSAAARLALTRKNALFAGHDLGAESWAMIASVIETCKLNAVDPLAWMTDVLTKLVNRWPASKIDELMPWAYAKPA